MDPSLTQSGEHEPLNLLEYELTARAGLSREAYDYFAGASWEWHQSAGKSRGFQSHRSAPQDAGGCEPEKPGD